MDKGTVNKPLNQFLKALPKSIKVKNIYIFGSHGVGSADADSDIDVLVVSEDFQGMDEDKRLDLLYKSSRFIKPEIHPWGVTPDEMKHASELTTIGDIRNTGISYF